MEHKNEQLDINTHSLGYMAFLSYAIALLRYEAQLKIGYLLSVHVAM
ncbi:hypothetical protein [Pseudoalteromonas sp. MMG005]|nr:hypothetical protein [Pseudoalteromonas sp. MMG005]MBQ4848265.1 hypothetical protein [Pseudoalteromonas sp. MMG005]